MSGFSNMFKSLKNPDHFVNWMVERFPSSITIEQWKLIYFALLIIVGLLLLFIAYKILSFIVRRIVRVYMKIKAFFSKRKKKSLPKGQRVRKSWEWLKRLHNLLNPEKEPIEEAFHESSKLLKQAFGGHEYMYNLPWYLVVGDERTGKTELLNSLNIKRPFGVHTQEEAFDLPITWHYFDYGVMLDIKGSAVYSENKRTSTSKIWPDLLQQLSYHRPRRPLDGIVLTVSAEDLYGPKKLSAADMRQKAHVLYQRLIAIQNTLSMRLPVYVIVTKLDSIPGFNTFAQSFPSSKLSNTFGWSAPHSLQQNYSPSWMQDAKQDVMSRISDLKLQAFTMMHQEENNINPDELFVFTEELDTIWENLEAFTNQLFAESMYKDPHFLRGIYFTGSSKAPPKETNDQLFVNRPAFNIYFSRDIFVEKIFRERNLAFPSHDMVRSIWRNLTTSKIVLLSGLSVSFLLAMLAHSQLRKSKNEILPMAQNIKHVLEEINETRKSGLEPTKDDFEVYKKHFAHFLDIASDKAKFWAIFIPPSWFSNYKKDMYVALGTSFDTIFVQSVHKYVQQKLDKLLVEPKEVSKLTKAEKSVFDIVDQKLSEKANPVKTKYFKKLSDFTTDLVALEKVTNSYNNFFISRRKKDLFSLVKDLFDYDLDSDFKSLFSLYNWSIRSDKYTKLDLSEHKKRIQHNFEKLFDDFLVHGISQNGSLKKVFSLNVLIDELADVDTYGDLSVQEFEGISKTIKDVIDVSYKTGDLAWIAEKKFDPGDEYSTFLNTLKRSRLITKKFANAQVARIQAAYLKLRDNVSGSYSTLLEGSVFNVDGGIFAANKELIEIKKFLDRFSDEAFMTKVEKKGLATKEIPQKHLLWDARHLANADKVLSGYYEFIEKGIEDYPQKLRPLLERVAKAQLHENLLNLLGAAQYSVSAAVNTIGSNPEEHYKVQVKSFSTAWPHLKKILNELTSVDELPDEVSDLLRFVSDQFIGVLFALDSIMDQEHLLRIPGGDFKWWDGSANPILQGFKATSTRGLEAILDTHFRRVAKLAKDYAKPSVNLLTEEFFPLQSTERILVKKWASILDESMAYEKKKAGNSVAKLLGLYTTELKDFKLSQAEKALSDVQSVADTGDYFLEERTKVVDALSKRVDAIAGYKLLEQYQKISDYFNENIAGRYPFARGEGVAQEVDLASLKELFALMNEQKHELEDYVAALKSRESSPERRIKFISGLYQLKQLFKDFADGKADMPSVSLQVHFHADKRRESASAKNLLDQEFDFGSGAPFDISDNGKKVVWGYGDPANVAFKLANGASMRVFNDGESEGSFAKTNDLEGAFSYDGGWALFRMLDNLGDASEKSMIRLSIPVETSKGVSSIRTFIRLTLQSADEKNSYTLPEFPKLPANAPTLSSKVLKNIRNVKSSKQQLKTIGWKQ